MLVNYIKIAWKVLLRHPFYTFITLFGISITLTVLMVVTSFMDHLLGVHYPEGNRDRSLFVTSVVQKDTTRSSRSSSPMSVRFIQKYLKTMHTPERVGMTSMFTFANAYVNGKRIKLYTKYTDADFWRVCTFEFLDGKPFAEQQTKSGDQVVVITDDFQKQYFENDSKSVIGREVEIESLKYRVIGVVKGSPATRPYSYADVYFPYTVPKSNYERGDMRGNFIAILMAKDKSELAAVQSEFQQAMSRIPQSGTEYGSKYTNFTIKAEGYADQYMTSFFGDDDSRRVFFFTAVAIILLMFMGLPALNLVNVNVGRMMERASEIGVRKAFGAPAKTLLYQFIVENIFITFIGGSLALVFSFIIIQLINNSGWIAYADLTINPTVFLISLGVCLLFGLLSGVLPAFRMSKLKIVDALKS